MYLALKATDVRAKFETFTIYYLGIQELMAKFTENNFYLPKSYGQINICNYIAII